MCKRYIFLDTRCIFLLINNITEQVCTHFSMKNAKYTVYRFFLYTKNSFRGNLIWNLLNTQDRSPSCSTRSLNGKTMLRTIVIKFLDSILNWMKWVFHWNEMSDSSHHSWLESLVNMTLYHVHMIVSSSLWMIGTTRYGNQTRFRNVNQ